MLISYHVRAPLIKTQQSSCRLAPASMVYCLLPELAFLKGPGYEKNQHFFGVCEDILLTSRELCTNCTIYISCAV